METHWKLGWLAALACEGAILGCGGHLTPSTWTGGNGGGGSSSTGGAGSVVTVGAGGMNGSATSTTATSGATTSGSTTSGGTGGGCRGACYCDPASWPSVEPQPVATGECSDFDFEIGAEGVHCIMPGGIWQVDVDGRGTPKDMSMKIENCGTTGNGLHFVGMGHTLWGADVAAAIVSQTQPVDVSAFRGMSFVMKSKAAIPLIFKVQNSYSQPPCGKCDELGTVLGAECYSGYTKNVLLPAGSTLPILVAWAELAQQTWGYRAPGTAMFDTRDLISVAFAFDTNIDFDVCLDDVKFVR
jgi:hypothetical protein